MKSKLIKMKKRKPKSKLVVWIEKQTFWSILSYVFGMVGIMLLIDGIVFVPYEVTRHGLTNISLHDAEGALLFSLIANINHRLTKGE